MRRGRPYGNDLQELAAMIAGEQDVQATMDHMQEQFQEILDSYNR